MKKLPLIAALGSALVSALAAAPIAAPAAPVNVQCANVVLTGGTYHDVTVPPGNFCSLSSATITGNVAVLKNAHIGVGNSTIAGNLDCHNCRFADLHSSTVGGNFLIIGETEGSFIDNSVIEGKLQITASLAVFDLLFAIHSNRVGGNLSFDNNDGIAFITDNTIGGNLQCHNNSEPPILTSARNTAKRYLGQCTA